MTETKFKGKTGPKKKERRSTQISITIPPELYDMLMTYMENNRLDNRSGTITNLIRAALSGV